MDLIKEVVGLFYKITSTVRQFNIILVKYVFNLIYNCVTSNYM